MAVLVGQNSEDSKAGTLVKTQRCQKRSLFGDEKDEGEVTIWFLTGVKVQVATGLCHQTPGSREHRDWYTDLHMQRLVFACFVHFLSKILKKKWLEKELQIAWQRDDSAQAPFGFDILAQPNPKSSPQSPDQPPNEHRQMNQTRLKKEANPIVPIPPLSSLLVKKAKRDQQQTATSPPPQANQTEKPTPKPPRPQTTTSAPREFLQSMNLSVDVMRLPHTVHLRGHSLLSRRPNKQVTSTGYLVCLFYRNIWYLYIILANNPTSYLF